MRVRVWNPSVSTWDVAGCLWPGRQETEHDVNEERFPELESHPILEILDDTEEPLRPDDEE